MGMGCSRRRSGDSGRAGALTLWRGSSPRIIDTVARRLDLDAEDVSASRDTLRRHGNCSSATTLLVLEELSARTGITPGQYVVAMAFGPGLTLYTVLLRAR